MNKNENEIKSLQEYFVKISRQVASLMEIHKMHCEVEKKGILNEFEDEFVQILKMNLIFLAKKHIELSQAIAERIPADDLIEIEKILKKEVSLRKDFLLCVNHVSIDLDGQEVFVELPIYSAANGVLSCKFYLPKTKDSATVFGRSPDEIQGKAREKILTYASIEKKSC